MLFRQTTKNRFKDSQMVTVNHKFPVPAIKCVTHESTSWTLYPPERFLQKTVEVAASDPILRSNTAIQVITGSPRHRFHCDVACTVAGRVDNARACRCRLRVQGASRPRFVRKPAKSEFLEYPQQDVSMWVRGALRNATKLRATTRSTGERRSRRGGSDERRSRAIAGYRESTTQIMMSKVDRTNALYYVVNVPKILRRDAECCSVRPPPWRFVDQLN